MKPKWQETECILKRIGSPFRLKLAVFSDPNWLCAPGANNGLEERRVLKSLDDYLIQSGMVKKKLDGIIVDAWINSLNVGGNTKAHYVSVYRQFAHYLTGLGYKAYIPPPLQIKRNYTPYVSHPRK